MKKILETRILEYSFDSEEERKQWVDYMASQGWQDSGQIKKDGIWYCRITKWFDF